MTQTDTQVLPMAQAGYVVQDLIDMINANRAYLSEIDGAIGDGDHGINMSKGFSQARERVAERPGEASLPGALDDLAMTLLEGIGGSMGPLYGGFFLAFSEALTGQEALNARNFGDALAAGVAAVQEVGAAEVGDKTLVDTLVPALKAYQAAQEAGQPFGQGLDDMVVAAKCGQESTKNMRAKLGRASRLGERSVGVLDAGATSCFLILESMAQSIKRGLTAATA